MRRLKAGLATGAACLLLGACHLGGGGGPPTGQVVAKVGDREITLRELRVEVGDATAPDPAARKALEMSALNNIIGRIILADAARERGLDKTPDFALQKQRLTDGLLAQTLQQKLIADTPAPTNDDLQHYMNEYPDSFIQRKVFTLDQVRLPRAIPPDVIKSLQPLKTLPEIEAVLDKNHIPHERKTATLDAASADPRLIQKIVQLPRDDLFLVPEGQALVVNQIKSVSVVPFTGQPAMDFARKVLTRQQVQDAVGRSFKAIMEKAKPKVQFNKDYAPPKAAPAPAGATPAVPPKAPTTPNP
jgi:EpsD family peptidyl-prolyl cis-trans isomerase